MEEKKWINLCFTEAETVCDSDGISGCDPKLFEGKGKWWTFDEKGECKAIETTGDALNNIIQ